jgi:hypothetical protein
MTSRLPFIAGSRAQGRLSPTGGGAPASATAPHRGSCSHERTAQTGAASTRQQTPGSIQQAASMAGYRPLQYQGCNCSSRAAARLRRIVAAAGHCWERSKAARARQGPAPDAGPRFSERKRQGRRARPRRSWPCARGAWAVPGCTTGRVQAAAVCVQGFCSDGGATRGQGLGAPTLLGQAPVTCISQTSCRRSRRWPQAWPRRAPPHRAAARGGSWRRAASRSLHRPGSRRARPRPRRLRARRTTRA